MNFALLDPAQIKHLSPKQLGGLTAYLMRQTGNKVSGAKMFPNYFDIEFDTADGGKEFLRCYFAPMPINASYLLLTELQGKNFLRVRLWATQPFTTAQRRAWRDVPLAFEMLDLAALQSRLAEAQRHRARTFTSWRVQKGDQSDNPIIAFIGKLLKR